MVYISHFLCTYLNRHNRTFFHPYDETKYKPCVGICGHSMCLDCIDEDPNRMCPMCGKEGQFVNLTPNYQLIEMIGDYREKYWGRFKEWWRQGNMECCRNCTGMERLRVCLTCSEYSCERPGKSIKPQLPSTEQLLSFSRSAVCESCIDSHANKGHKTVRIDKIKFSTHDMRKRTATTILDMFGRKSKHKNDLRDCILRKRQLDSREDALCSRLESSDDICVTFLNAVCREDDECGLLSRIIRKTIVEKLIQDIDSLHSELTDGKNIKCECALLYDKLNKSGTTTDFESIFDDMWPHLFNTPGCPLDHCSNKEKRLKLYSLIDEVPETNATHSSFDEIKCPLCIFASQDHQDSIVQHDWLRSIENIWQSEMPLLETYCVQCLDFLIQNGVGKPCERCMDIDKKKWHRHQLNFFIEYPTKNSSAMDLGCIVNETIFWKYNIIFAIRHMIRKIMIDRVENAPHHCRLQKMRMMSTIHWFHYHLSKIDLRECTGEDLLRRKIQVEKYLTSIRFQWDTYVTESEKQPMECICSAPLKHLDKAVSYFWETKHEKLKSYRKLQLEFACLADEQLTTKIKSCPLNFGLSNERRFPNSTFVKQFYSDFVFVFCADDKLLMDFFYIGPHHEDEDFSEVFGHLFVME